VFADAFLAAVVAPPQIVPVVGTPHRPPPSVELIVDGTVQHVSPVHEIAAAGAVVLRILATVLAVVVQQMSDQTITS
jgi:hypothetical protein